LNNDANQLARHLRKNGIELGFRVGIAMPRSPRWITALLGALKAGACIVPVAEGTSQASAGIKAWIVDELPEGESRDLPVIQVKSDAAAISGEKSRGAQNESAPASDAIAWTEGPTTHSFSHETLAAALQGTSALLGLTPTDRVLQFAPTATFAAVEEALCALLSGATIVLRADSRWTTRTAFHEFIEQQTVTTLSVPTTFWSQWTHYLADLSLHTPPTLRLAVIHGAQSSPNAVAAWRTACGETRLLLRTTAAAACGLGIAGDPTEPSLIGAPSPASTARLVDKRGLPLPAGLAGWADIAPRGGAFVPFGVEAFVSPELVFHARATLQALTAGPAPDVISESIRLAAATHPEVLDAHVERRLIAARHEWCVWIVPRDSEHGEPHDFREWLAERLPSVPRRIRAVPRLPLDEAGNIDAAALSELLPDDGSALPAQKGTDEEERVRKAVSRVLGGRRMEFDESISEGRTKPHVAKLLHEAVVREEPRVQLSDFAAGFSVRSLLRNVRGRKSGADSKWTPLEPLRASGKQPPLIFIHDFDGTAKPYGPLVAHLDGDQPCYAITARG
ncbi:MAG: AMP-binding protein, partial [Chthoniobacterales bacterium]